MGANHTIKVAQEDSVVDRQDGRDEGRCGLISWLMVSVVYSDVLWLVESKSNLLYPVLHKCWVRKRGGSGGGSSRGWYVSRVSGSGESGGCECVRGSEMYEVTLNQEGHIASVFHCIWCCMYDSSKHIYDILTGTSPLKIYNF